MRQPRFFTKQNSQQGLNYNAFLGRVNDRESKMSHRRKEDNTRSYIMKLVSLFLSHIKYLK